jgi:ABC-type Na+ efflux pump permease subunit
MNVFSNPVLVKELRGRMRGNRAMILLTIYLSIIGIVTLLVYLAIASSISFGASDFEAGRRIGKAIFLTVMSAALAQVCLITPSLTSSSIAGEKERQSYDLLITTLLSPWQIVLGKLMAALAFALLLIIAVLPLAGLSFLFGGVSGVELVLALVGLMVTAVLYASIGLLWSTIMRGTQGATVMAQGTVLLWLLGVPFLFIIFGAMVFDNQFMRDLSNSSLFIYFVGTILCSHPFIALGITQGLLMEGENPFYFTIDIDAGQQLLAPSPWLAFTVIALLLAGVCMLVSMRLLRPTGGAPRRGRKQEG